MGMQTDVMPDGHNMNVKTNIKEECQDENGNMNVKTT